MQMTTAAETPDGEALNFDNTSMVTDISITRSVLVACLSSDDDADGCSGGKTRRVAGREKPMLDAECKICGFKGRTTCKDRIRIKCGGSCKDQHDQWKICNDRPTKRLRPATPPVNTPLSLAPSTPQLQSQPLPTTPIKLLIFFTWKSRWCRLRQNSVLKFLPYCQCLHSSSLQPLRVQGTNLSRHLENGNWEGTTCPFPINMSLT